MVILFDEEETGKEAEQAKIDIGAPEGIDKTISKPALLRWWYNYSLTSVLPQRYILRHLLCCISQTLDILIELKKP